MQTVPEHETVRPDRKKQLYNFPARRDDRKDYIRCHSFPLPYKSHVCPKQVLDDLLHIILYAALSGSAVPARKAAKAGFNIHAADGKLFRLNIPNSLLHAIQK